MGAEALSQGNQVKVIKASSKWLGKVGTVIDDGRLPYPSYPVQVHFGDLQQSEYFTREQLEKLPPDSSNDTPVSTEIKHIILKNEVENRVLFLQDTDLWGIVNALEHAIRDGYANDNLDWHKNMVAALNGMRDGGWMS